MNERITRNEMRRRESSVSPLHYNVEWVSKEPIAEGGEARLWTAYPDSGLRGPTYRLISEHSSPLAIGSEPAPSQMIGIMSPREINIGARIGELGNPTPYTQHILGQFGFVAVDFLEADREVLPTQQTANYLAIMRAIDLEMSEEAHSNPMSVALHNLTSKGRLDLKTAQHNQSDIIVREMVDGTSQKDLPQRYTKHLARTARLLNAPLSAPLRSVTTLR